MKLNKQITAIIAIVVGLMFIAMKGEVISIALSVLGAGFLIMGIMSIAKKEQQKGVLGIIAGAAVLIFGWLFVNVALTVVAVLMILFCGMNLVGNLKNDGYPMSTVQTIKVYSKPIMGLVAGICLLFNQGGTVAWVFVLAGILFVLEGIMMLSEK